MPWYFLSLAADPERLILPDEPGTSVAIDDDIYYRLDDIVSDTLFYDFYCNSKSEIVAIELHLDPEKESDRNFWNLLPAHTLADHRLFPLIPFGDMRDSYAMGVEAFGDLRLYHGRSGKIAIAFDPSPWTSRGPISTAS